MRQKLVILKFLLSLSYILTSCQTAPTTKDPTAHLPLAEIGQSKNRYNIGIGMHYSENYSPFADIGAQINALYAKRHGYTFIVDKTTYLDENEFTLHWNKYPFSAKHVKNFDYFVWIDADAVFMIQERRLEDLIDFYQSDIIVSDDMWQTHDGNMNTGVIIFKGGDWSYDLLKHMMKANICKDYHKNPYHDQTCLELMRSTNYNKAKEKIRIIAHKDFQGPQDGGFIYHMAGTKDKQKIVEKFRDILKKTKEQTTRG